MTAVAKGMKPIRENLYFVAASLSDYPENKYSSLAVFASMNHFSLLKVLFLTP
jgi:hypothetical protein